ncbi:MAG: phenylalanine--tRNA ligase beta subunit-related protein [Candidatus Bathyarchaeota archaeon]|nr:phenylalanine--tRNA ligase beta subunit-related protein [Candidatus Bathyarchaeota archaeon]
MFLDVEADLAAKFPGLRALIIRVKDVDVRPELRELEQFKEEVAGRTKERWNLDQLREHPAFRAYRDFFWRVGIDPTKTRPAAEALIRRVLRGRPLPKINTLVDAYNLASIESTIPLAAFDEDDLAGDLLMRQADAGEEFLGIGMDKPTTLKGGEVVVQDGEKLVAIYPHRDADACKITLDTKNTLMLICGVPNIEEGLLKIAGRVAVGYIIRFCGGSEA